MFKAYMTLDFDDDTNIDCYNVILSDSTKEELFKKLREYIYHCLLRLIPSGSSFCDDEKQILESYTGDRYKSIEKILIEMWNSTFNMNDTYSQYYGNWAVKYDISEEK